MALDWAGRRDELRAEEKQGLDDLVSQADREAEDAIREVIARSRPDDAILGEERPDRIGGSGVRRHVDPIDGTTNYSSWRRRGGGGSSATFGARARRPSPLRRRARRPRGTLDPV